jgi:hypothetical protein
MRHTFILPCSPCPRWLLGGLLVGAALLAEAGLGQPAQAMQLASGSYVGDGATARAIHGVGFRPDAVIIKGTDAHLAVMRTATMVGDAAKELAAATRLQASRIRSLDADGFTVGPHAEVNGKGVTYFWTAFTDDGAGDFRAGAYVGTGRDDLSIGGLGFRPSYLIVMPDRNERAVQRSSAMVGDYSLMFDGTGPKQNYIQALQADGFQVGTDARVNASGATYHYVAWKAGPGTMAVGSYTGDDRDGRSITGVGFRPDYLIIKASVKETAVHRPALLAGDATLTFSAKASLADAIQGLEADGFQVGTANTVNGVHTTYFWMAFRSPSATPIATLAIASVNDGKDPVADTAFTVRVGARDATGASRNVATATGVRLDLKTGSAPLGGTVTGTIPAGMSEVTISGITYTRAEDGVTLTASRTSGDILAPGDSTPFTVRPGATASYTVSPSSPQPAGVAFAVTVSAQDLFANIVTTDSATAVVLDSVSGAVMFDGNADGVFGDNTTTLNAGTATVNARSTTAESTTVTATDANGKTGSAPLTITAGTASTLAFTTQPGNVTAGSPLPGPPTITVQDSLGNRVTSSTASIGLTLGANPAGGLLAGTTSKDASEGLARFDDLTISQPGSGYMLIATAPGLTGASSAAFTVTALTGALSGMVTAASDGHSLNEASVEALQAGVVTASAATSANGTYSMAGLLPGSYDVRASATGYRSRTSTGIVVTGGSTTTTDFSLDAVTELAIRITTPTTGSILHEPITVVEGEVSGEGVISVSLTTSTTIQGQPIELPVTLQVNGGRFAALMGLTPGTVQLTARATDSTRRSGQDSVTISFQPDPPDYDQAAPPDVSPTTGFAPLTVTFRGTEAADAAITGLDLDVDGDGQPDFTLADFATPPHQVAYTYQQEGLYIAATVVRDQAGVSRTTRVPINVIPMPDLPPIWDAFRDALLRGDIDEAIERVALEARDRYRRVLGDLVADLPAFAAGLGPITVHSVTTRHATASITRLHDGVSEGFLIHFLRDADGVWRIASM